MAGHVSKTRFAYLIIYLFLCISSHGQSAGSKSFSQQLSVLTENDRYLMQGRDRYYTNGLMIKYQNLHRAKNPAIIKQVDQYEMGQKLFTPYSRKIYDVSQIDRPVTGYLYLKYTQSKFMEHNQFWEWGISVGAIGDASLGEAMQNSFHKLISVNSDWWGWIWKYQLNSEVGFNLHGSYAKALLGSKSVVQITPFTQAVLGTIFSNISQGVLIQFGKFNPISESAYWNASIQDKQTTKPVNSELFFYYHPEVSWQLYNATVQGGLFRKDKGPIVSSIESFVVKHQIGVLVGVHRYMLKLEAVLQTKEASSQYFGHNYGSIHLGYMFN